MLKIEELLNELENSYRINREIIVVNKEIDTLKIKKESIKKAMEITDSKKERMRKDILVVEGVIKDREENIINKLTFYEDEKLEEIRTKIIKLKQSK